METITIIVINPKTNLSKNIDVTEYTNQDLYDLKEFYKSVKYKMKFKRSV